MRAVVGLFLCLTGLFLSSCASMQKADEANQQKIVQANMSQMQRMMRPNNREYTCQFRYSRWYPYGVQVRAAPNSPNFGRLLSAQGGVRSFLFLPRKGPRVGAFMKLEAHGVAFRAWAPGPKTIPFYPNHPVRFGAHVIATGRGRLVWEGYYGRKILVSLPTEPTYTPKKRVIAGISCEEITLLRQKLVDVRAAANLPEAQKKVFLKQGMRIRLRAEPRGHVEGTLFFKYAPRAAELIEEKDGYALIFLKYWSFAVFGWVSRDAILSSKPAMGLGGILGRGMGGGGKQIPLLRCKHELPLYVGRDKKSWKIGLIRAHTPFQSLQAQDPWLAVRFQSRQRWVQLYKGFSFRVPANALRDCQLVPSTPKPMRNIPI